MVYVPLPLTLHIEFCGAFRGAGDILDSASYQPAVLWHGDANRQC